MSNDPPSPRNRVDLYPTITGGESRPYDPAPCVGGCGFIVACRNGICWHCDHLRWLKRLERTR